VAEVRITRTCRLGLAFVLLAAAAPAAANVDDRAELAAYAKARAADTFGASGDAARGYAALLALSPGNELLASRALGQAIEAGDYQVALQAARILGKAGQLAPEARLILLSEALRTRDWKAATTQVDAIAADEVFSFMAPTLRAWIAFESRQGDPFAILDGARSNALALTYAAEQRPFLLLASGKREQGAAELLRLTEAGGGRAHRLRIAGAALLARKRDRERAAGLLAGDAAPLRAARALLERRKPIPGEIANARAGIAEFLVRVAVDLQRQEATAIALVHARLATFLAPENSETWLVASDLLQAQRKDREALTVLANVAADDPFAAQAIDSRTRLLIQLEDKQAALAEAEAASKRANATAADWSRLGEVYGSLERHAESAEAYAQAIARAEGDAAAAPLWTLWLLRGSALDEAGKWPEAKAALTQAYRLAPNQPVVLNYLGYAQLERRENVVEAERLIREASRLEPDDAAITDSLGWAHYIGGNLPRAIELLEKAAEGEPADPAINEHLGDAYYSAGRRYEARYAWEAALLYAEDEDAKRLRAKIDAGLTPKLAAP
jgi:tetratricopeptide (TPR) repeat protein